MSHGMYQARFIKFTLRHPLQANLQYSCFNDTPGKTMVYTLRFVSMIGSCSSSETEVTNVLQQIKQENSLELLSHFFKGKFSQAFQQIA